MQLGAVILSRGIARTVAALAKLPGESLPAVLSALAEGFGSVSAVIDQAWDEKRKRADVEERSRYDLVQAIDQLGARVAKLEKKGGDR